MEPERFLGDPEGYRRWREANPQPFNPQWCASHWEPCPVEGRLGVVATVLLMTESFALLPEGVTEPHQINSWWANQTVPACCQLGDERMGWIWHLCRTDDDPLRPVKCLEKNVSGKGRSCFLPERHEGLHDFQRALLEPSIMSVLSDPFRQAWGEEPFPPLETI